MSDFDSAWLRAYESRNAKQPEAQGGCDDESELQKEIITYCTKEGWVVFYSSMVHRTTRRAGEPDLEIYADGSRHWIVECKTRTGKLSPEQLGIKMWLEKLGHTVHVVRSMAEFMELIKK